MPTPVTDDIARQFAALGVAVAVETGPEDVAFPVWRENWPTLCLFCRLETQWRIILGGAGPVWLGLDYVAVDVVMRRLGADDVDFSDIQTMEAAALAVLNGSEADGA